MTIYQAVALLAAGVGGGIAGTMASVASVVSYPALLALGLPPLAANVTNTMSLVFCVPGAVLGARPELTGQRSRVLRFGAVMAAGGALGAAVLLLAPPGAFALAVPVLICFAAVGVLLQPRLRALSPRPGAEQSRRRLVVMFCVAAYLGYFGGGGRRAAARRARRHDQRVAYQGQRDQERDLWRREPGGRVGVRPVCAGGVGVRAAARRSAS